MIAGSREKRSQSGGHIVFDCNLRIGFVCLVFTTTLASFGEAPQTATTASVSPVRELSGLNDELQTLAARISPSVVKIEVSGLTAVHDLN